MFKLPVNSKDVLYCLKKYLANIAPCDQATSASGCGAGCGESLGPGPGEMGPSGGHEHYIVMLTIIHPLLSGDHLILGATLTREGGGLMGPCGVHTHREMIRSELCIPTLGN